MRHGSGDVAAARDSLRGLTLGDQFGERWFFRGGHEAIAMIRARSLAGAVESWNYTDDTEMALSILKVLYDHGTIDPQTLASEFGTAHHIDAYRGYGSGMRRLLPNLYADPGNWATHARALFDGVGSLGNGAAMRSAPLGAWFHTDLVRVVAEAKLASAVTHAHPNGISGGVAVAVAAALAAESRGGPAPRPVDLLRRTADSTPDGPIRNGLLQAAELPGSTPPWQASDILGNGQQVRASDTVPFAVWSAAHHLDDLAGALWTTAEGLGDVDTTCAITGGVVGARTGWDGVPDDWRERCEALPEWVDA